MEYEETTGMYHVYFHAVGSEKLFRSDENYRYFLEKYSRCVSPIADTYAYALLPNHVHFLVKSKSKESDLSKAFGKLKNSYTKSFNMTYERYGVLFTKYIQSKEVNNERYYKNVIHYINRNAVHHGICSDINDWKYCSYSAVIEDKVTQIKKDDVLKYFDGLENYIDLHKKEINLDETLTLE